MGVLSVALRKHLAKWLNLLLPKTNVLLKPLLILKRACLGLSIGFSCGAVIGAVGFNLAGLMIRRSIGLLPNGPLLTAIIGGLFLGFFAGLLGMLIGIMRLNRRKSLILGSSIGLLLVINHWFQTGGNGYVYEMGYIDYERLFFDLITWSTEVLGLALVGWAVAAVINQRSTWTLVPGLNQHPEPPSLKLPLIKILQETLLL
jgi:hypothetical protein